MSEFTYTYKTSDGVRREGRISAASRDGAFAALRTQGIRPIKVIAGESGGNGRYQACLKVIFAGVVVCVVGAVSFWLGSARRAGRMFGGGAGIVVHGKYSSELDRLRERAEASQNLHRVEMGALGLDMFRDYTLIYGADDLSPFVQTLAKARKSIEEARGRMRELFGDIYSTFPPECTKERFSAQKIYGEMMTELDADEERVMSDHEILTLLNDSRAGWRVENGRIVFSDKILERKFEYLLHDADPAAMRWRKDFGASFPDMETSLRTDDELKKRGLPSSSAVSGDY